MYSLQHRLTHAEADFLLAVSQGGPALISFRDQWLALLKDMECGARTHSIDDETVSLGDLVASRIAIMSESLLDFQSSADLMQSQLEDVFAGIDITDMQFELPQASRTTSPPATSLAQESLPNTVPHSSLYIKHAQRWLLKNLHNPYPPKSVRDAIASSTASDRKCIDTWFIDARKRIGWNTLRREMFSNKRVDIVDAAMRFFGEDDTHRPLDENIRFRFLEIEMRVRELYDEKLSESALATKLDIVVKDMTSERKAQETVRKLRQRRKDRAMDNALATLSYPSPHLSPHHVPEHLPPYYELDTTVAPPMPITGFKRSNTLESQFKLPFTRNKRPRTDGVIGLPSPAPSQEEPLSPEEQTKILSDAIGFVDPVRRKRRLSDSDSQHVPKRPRNNLSGSRSYSVSDSLHPSYTSSLWNESHPNILSTAISSESNPSVAFDIELYNYSNLIQELYPSIEFSGASNDAYCRPDTCTLSPEAAFSGQKFSNDFDRRLPLDIGIPSSDFTSSETSALSLFESSLSQTSFNMSSAVPDTVTIADYSLSMPSDSDPGFHWMFPPLSQDLYNISPEFGYGSDRALDHESSKLDFGPQSPYEDVVLRVLVEADRTAKQKRLEEMKEATRRLEAEIAAS
ncbi:C-terminal domain of homeodomain 1-domain-containing protein [Collybia nuda]|uniref:C-terminal domain of homeodomain 1-domain-containing protein n=1 Tax=Collybia nuda TaxID=64659 RepID=A0A9P5XU95_9AGAR|nr:C-terminal domain of homeodomain 1-domain-containing protein [Collybia nuda]